MVLTGIVCLVTRRILEPFLPRLIKGVPREIARDLVEHNLMPSTTSLWNVIYRGDIAEDLTALPNDLPVTFVNGNADQTAPVGPVRRLAALRPSSTLVELEGVDYHPWLRRPDQCSAVIRSR